MNQDLIHLCGMLCNICQEMPYCVSMMTCNTLNTPDTILFDKMFADHKDFCLGKMLPEERSAFRFHKERLAMITIIALAGCFCIFTSLNNVLSLLQAIISTIRVLTYNIYVPTWSGHSNHKIQYVVIDYKVRYSRTLPKNHSLTPATTAGDRAPFFR
ncbi:MAG: hypothetical protein XE11_0219 [Methanomicrobiales archaeon 53_19]|nr:MAG: hypothetical protein XE11_0219 [Methanomicrobiales archaeon 53_19]